MPLRLSAQEGSFIDNESETLHDDFHYRPGSIQNSAQVKFIKTFKVHLDKLNDLSDPKVDLIGVAKHQALLLTGIDRLRYKNVPRVSRKLRITCLSKSHV